MFVPLVEAGMPMPPVVIPMTVVPLVFVDMLVAVFVMVPPVLGFHRLRYSQKGQRGGYECSCSGQK